MKWATHELATPVVNVTIGFRGDEIRNGVLRFGAQRLPAPVLTEDADSFLASLWKLPSIQLKLRRLATDSLSSVQYPSYDVFQHVNNNGQTHVLAVPIAGNVVSQGMIANAEDTLPALATLLWNEDMFWFNAERFAIGESAHGYSNRLEPNAQNLPNVLHTLNGTRGSVYLKLVEHLREIFPTVGNLSVSPKTTGQLEIRVWPTKAMDRVELRA